MVLGNEKMRGASKYTGKPSTKIEPIMAKKHLASLGADKVRQVLWRRGIKLVGRYGQVATCPYGGWKWSRWKVGGWGGRD
jgi:hypothetical protein